MNIRPFTDKDYFTICQWHMEQGEMPPAPDMMPLDSSFILEVNNIPVVAVALYLTNSKDVCYVENLIGNPKFKSEGRKFAVEKLQNFIEGFAKDKGYRRLVCLAYKEKLKKRYQELGYKKIFDNITEFCKEL